MQKKQYFVGTNGLSGKCTYMATDPDEALTFAHRHERFLRISGAYPKMSPEQVMTLAKEREDIEMFDFRIDYCFLKDDE